MDRSNAAEHAEDILGAYLAAASPGHWLVDEISGYLFEDLPDDDRDEQLAAFFERLDRERDRFFERQYAREDLVQFVLEIHQRGGTVLRTSFSVMPVPAILLEICVKLAEPGDRIVVRHRYASEDSCEFEAVWPVGMDWAVGATTPMAETLQEEHAEDLAAAERIADASRRLTRTAGALAAAAVAGSVAAARFLRRKHR